MSYLVKFTYTGEGPGLRASSLPSRASLTEAILQMRSFESLLHTSGMRTRDELLDGALPGFERGLVVTDGAGREIARVWIEQAADAATAPAVETSPGVKPARAVGALALGVQL
jgi:hypothetical protein